MFKNAGLFCAFVLLIAGCSGGGKSSPENSPQNSPGPNSDKVQQVSRCEALQVGARCLASAFWDFAAFLDYQSGQSINVRESEDKMMAASSDGSIVVKFANPLTLPDFGTRSSESVDLTATKDGRYWFSFLSATPGDFRTSDLKVSYLNKSFGLKLVNNTMRFTCTTGEVYEVDNWSSAETDCNQRNTSPFANMPTFSYASPNQCGISISLNVPARVISFLDIYNPMSQACR